MMASSSPSLAARSSNYHESYNYAPILPAPIFSRSTAYTGADGQIDISELDDDALVGHSSRSSSPVRSVASAKAPLSARLSSALQNAQPALNRSRSVLHSRAKSLAAWTSGLNTNTGDRAQPTTNRLFGDLFSGESAPVRLSLLPPQTPIKEEEDSEFVMEYIPSFTERPSLGRRRTSVSDRRQSQVPSKQSWFAQKLGRSTTTLPAAVPEHDELLTLNINNELFPNGPADPCSPSAFNDLLLNATALLERMQHAYREKTEYIASINPEIEAQREEVEEAETRAQHLKMQLEDMGRRAQEQESAMRQLATQLADEKLKVQELRNTSHSIRVIEEQRPERRRKRSSAGSASDSGFESDMDRADTESIASGSTSPSWTDVHERRSHMTSPTRLQRQAHYQSYNMNARHDGQISGGSVSMMQLQNENQQLRRQVEEMQGSLQGCIEILDVLKV